MTVVEDTPGALRLPEENRLIAARLNAYAELLEVQGADGFRVKAYRKAAGQIGAMSRSLREIFDQGGTGALIALPAIGRGIAAALAEMLTTGHWRQLERLQGSLTPEALFRTIPGIGKELAGRLVDRLDVETLEDLEAALRRGEPAVPGIGPRRRDALLASLGQRLARLRQAAGAGPGRPREAPPVSLLLDADALYRRRAAAGTLRRIAPRRLNPEGAAWLPILHARRGAWHLTLLFSNTALAHELGRTGDWVVIYFHEDDGHEGRCTVVTERQGDLAGKRVVRGREDECRRHHAAAARGAPAPADNSPA